MKIYEFNASQSKLIERIVNDEHVMINHMIFYNGDATPLHLSDSHVYVIIIRGAASITLNDASAVTHPSGSIVNIPFETQMQIANNSDDVLEFFVVKAPNPRDMASN